MIAEYDEARREALWPRADRLWRAVMLAPRIEVAEALLAGEEVPLDRLDAEWVARLGLRRRRQG